MPLMNMQLWLILGTRNTVTKLLYWCSCIVLKVQSLVWLWLKAPAITWHHKRYCKLSGGGEGDNKGGCSKVGGKSI